MQTQQTHTRKNQVVAVGARVKSQGSQFGKKLPNLRAIPDCAPPDTAEVLESQLGGGIKVLN